MQHIAYLGLGSNQNDPAMQLRSGITALFQHPDINLLKCSSYYVSKPVDHSNQADFWNLVIAIKTCLSPLDLLSMCHKIEKQHHRKRIKRWGPRTLDIDILLFDEISLDEKNCTIPHKEMLNRDFVLTPLYEIAPTLILPDKRPLASLYQNAPRNITVRYPATLTTRPG